MGNVCGVEEGEGVGEGGVVRGEVWVGDGGVGVVDMHMAGTGRMDE